MKDFIACIKEYSTKNLIYFFAETSIAIYKKQFKMDKIGVFSCAMTFPLKVLLHGFIHKTVSVTLYAWEIPDMAYASIINANDYRKKEVLPDELGIIVNLYRGYENDKSGSEYLKNAEISGVFKYLMGMTYEQFRYETMGWSIQNFNRNYHILIGSSKICRDKIVDINEVTQKIFGMNIDELLTTELIILWLCSQHSTPLDAPEELYCRKTGSMLTKENIKKIIQYYSVTYNEIRTSGIGKQIFYSKPFVHTQKGNEYIMISIYLVQMVFSDGLYWLMRDYYLNNNGGQVFINTFGKMFEDYFEEIAALYLQKNYWYKIPEGKGKSADYYIEFEEAVFLFELKSGLMGIGAKQQIPDIEQINKFYRRNIVEAYEQLKASEGDYQGKKPIIKVFLLYEFSNNTQLMMSSIPEIFDRDDKCYIMSIQDLEMFLVTYKRDINKFNRVLEAMLKNNHIQPHYKSVLHILDDQKATGDFHFKGERDYLKKIIDKLEVELN